MGLFDSFLSAAPLLNTVTAPIGLAQQAGGIGGIASSLTPQNGYQANAPLDVGSLQSQLNTAQGNFNQTQGNQNALASALLAQSQGQGPNVAQNQLNQNTNQNIQQNAGMIASQKGINPALAARLASENASNISQQAAGQGAVLGAQQQVAAQQQLGSLYNNQATQNNQNAQLSGSLANQSSLGAQQINAGTSAQNAAANQNTSSGLLNGAGAALTSFLNKGGVVQHFDGGGAVSASSQIANGMASAAGVPQYANGVQTKSSLPLGGVGGAASSGSGLMAGGADASDLSGAAVLAASKGGKIPQHMHPIAKIYHPNFQSPQTAQLKSQGGPVPGKAKTKGDSPKNDTVPTMLSPDEIVLPRSVTMAKDPAQEAAKFVAQEMKKRGDAKNVNAHGDFKEALKKAVGSRRGK